LAYPILKKFNIPATIFLSTDFISRRSWLWSNKLEYILRNTQQKAFSFSLGDKECHFDVNNFVGWHKTQLEIFNFCAQISNSQKNVILSNLMESLKVNVPDKTEGDFVPMNWDQINEMEENGIGFGSHTCSHPIQMRPFIKPKLVTIKGIFSSSQ